MDQRLLLSFRAARRRLALPLDDVQRVAPVPHLHPPVGAPHFVEGFFDFQGQPAAAIRLDRLLGLAEDKLGLYAPLLLLAHEQRHIALHVAGVDAILKTTAAQIQPIAAEETFNGCVLGRFDDRGDTVYLLSRQNLFLTLERDTLAAHRAMQARRLDALDSNTVHAA